jgi:hypothetical protein
MMVTALFIIRRRATSPLPAEGIAPGAPTVSGRPGDYSKLIVANLLRKMKWFLRFRKQKLPLRNSANRGLPAAHRRRSRRDEQSEALMTRIETNERTPVKMPARQTDDQAKVRMGSMSPSFPAVRPAAASSADAGRIEMGSMSPAFPPVRAA